MGQPLIDPDLLHMIRQDAFHIVVEHGSVANKLGAIRVVENNISPFHRVFASLHISGIYELRYREVYVA